MNSGLEVAWDQAPAPGTSALGLFVDVGSRDEGDRVFGASHFLEHAVFKGAGNLSGREIAEVGDRLGAEINAFTTRDYTCFYGKSMDPMLKPVYELIQTMVSKPWLADDDVERERQVIIEEMRQSYDDTSDRVAEAFMRAMYQGESFTHDVLGTSSTVEGLSGSSLREFHQQFYRPARMVLALAGAGGRAIMEELVGDGQPGALWLRTPPIIQAREVIIEEDREQVQIMLGVPAPVWGSEESYVCDLLTTLIGGQTSSRLWQRLREEEGLVYSVDADYQAEPDWAVMTIGLAVHHSHLEQALHVIASEMRDILLHGFTMDELERAKVQLRAGLWFGLETVDHRMLHLGRYLLQRQLPPSIAELEAKIEAVQADQLMEMMSQLWADPKHLAAAAVGPVGSLVLQDGLKEHLL